MSELEAAGNDASVAPVPAVESFGRRLAAERERQGLSIDDIAARLRLHRRQVQAIESESLPSLPAPFLRGFVRNYAKELRLDPEPLVAELSARLGPQPEKVPRVDSSSGNAPRLVTTELASRRVVIGGAIAALIALALLGWLATRGERRAEAPPPATGMLAAPAAPAAPPSMTAPAPDATKDAQAQPSGTVTTPLSSSDAPSSAPSSPGAATASTVAAGATPVAAPVVAAPPSGGLRMTFREQAWVEVAQGDGRIVHSQINAAGSEQRIDGKAPLKLVVGNASAVSVEYKGKAVDLKPVTSADNVARVTLN